MSNQLVGTELTRATVGLVGSALGWRGVAVECAFGSHGMQTQIQLICFWKDIYLWILGFVQLKYDEIISTSCIYFLHHDLGSRGQSLTRSSCTAACSQSLVALVGDAQRTTFFLLYLGSFLRSTYSYLDHWTSNIVMCMTVGMLYFDFVVFVSVNQKHTLLTSWDTFWQYLGVLCRCWNNG